MMASWMLMLMALACRKHMGYVCAQVVCLRMRGINLWMRKNSPRLPGFCMGAVKKSIWAVFFFFNFFLFGPMPHGAWKLQSDWDTHAYTGNTRKKKKKNRYILSAIFLFVPRNHPEVGGDRNVEILSSCMTIQWIWNRKSTKSALIG